MTGTAVMGQSGARSQFGTADLGQLVVIGTPASEVHKPLAKTRMAELIGELLGVAEEYIRGAKLNNATLEVRDGVAVLTNAPFVGEVPICGIEYGRVVPYF